MVKSETFMSKPSRKLIRGTLTTDRLSEDLIANEPLLSVRKFERENDLDFSTEPKATFPMVRNRPPQRVTAGRGRSAQKEVDPDSGEPSQPTPIAPMVIAAVAIGALILFAR